MSDRHTILVTGGTGFLGSWCVLSALEQGYRVRTTVRSLKRASKVKDMLLNGGATQEQADSVDFIVADLAADDGWAEACKGCTWALHVASPLPLTHSGSDEDIIRTAKEGALRVLVAAKEAGVKRVVLTSSFAAIGYGHEPRDEPFDESDWTDTTHPKVTAYYRSKVFAERAAFDYIAAQDASLAHPIELSVINPVAIVGPVLGSDFAISVQSVSRQLLGHVPATPRISFGVVDVRDLAKLHFLAMVDPKAAGERYLASADDGCVTLMDVAGMLRESDLPWYIRWRLPLFEVPDIVIRVAGMFSSTVAFLVDELGAPKKGSSAKARRELGWTPRSVRECVIDTAHSLLRLGLV